MTKKEIIYINRSCPPEIYNKLNHKTHIAAAKFNQCIIKGLSKYMKVNSLYIYDSIFQQQQIYNIGNVDYHFIPHLSKVKRIHYMIKTLHSIHKRVGKNGVLIADALCFSDSLIAIVASKLYRWKKIGIITDLPEFIGDNEPINKRSFKSRQILKLQYFVMNCFDYYILLTQDMTKKIKVKSLKNYLVIEGFADLEQFDNINAHKKNQFLYAGSLHKEYGIDNLIKAFNMFCETYPSDIQLKIYGKGNYTEEIIKMAEENKQIIYGGVVCNQKIIEEELSSLLLINPRPIQNCAADSDFTKYSFPSKNIEYMSSGTPLLATKLAGMPKEYYTYIYGMDTGSVEEIYNALVEIFLLPETELILKGSLAKKFMKENKSYDIQVKKILNYFELIDY